MAQDKVAHMISPRDDAIAGSVVTKLSIGDNLHNARCLLRTALSTIGSTDASGGLEHVDAAVITLEIALDHLNRIADVLPEDFGAPH